MNELKKYFTFGGGETRELTCLEAADRFVKNVLSKNLESENVRFPEHIIRLGVTPEGPKLSKQELEERGNKVTDTDEKNVYNTHLTALKGNECEKAVWDYIIRTPSNVRCATFMSYDNKMFLQFTGASDTTKTKAPDAQNPDAEKDEDPDDEKPEDSDVGTTANKSTQTQDEDFPKKVPKIKAKKSANNQAHGANKSSKAMANKSTKDEDHGDTKCPEGRSHKATQTKSPPRKVNKGPPTDNQEFDFVFLLGEYKTFVVFEVKSSSDHVKGKWEDQLERAELFYKTIIKYMGDEDYKDWTFLPVAAFPNATDIKQVIFFSNN